MSDLTATSLTGPLIIVAAPSGAGKSSFVDRICREMPRLVDTVTYTTREPRSGESEGNPYHFVSRQKFDELLSQNFFVEWARVHTNMYGTPWYQLQNAWKDGKCIIMDIDIQGWETFRTKFPTSTSIFILPPSMEELRRRVLKRDAVLPKDFEVRMNNAALEITRAPEFDYQLINDNFEESYSQFKKIVEEILSKL